MDLNRSEAPIPRRRWALVLMHVAALAPLVLLLWDWTAGRLSFNPIREITLRTGRYALLALIASLACTPVYLLSRFRPILRMRRALGLYAFMYAALHLLTFVGLDFGFNLGFIVDELAQRRFIQVGLLSFLILLSLAITSSRWWIRRLGRNWKRLHRLAYLAALLALLHFFWVVKGDIRRPLIYGIVLALLLFVRIPAIQRALAHLWDVLVRQNRIEDQAAKR
jgi:methionine sulfoxide reductase heme-binding subunit